MEVIIQSNAKTASELAGRLVAKTITNKANAVLGLATGSTPIKLYQEMIRHHQESGLDLSQVVTYNLDEYVNLSPEHHCSYRYFMNHNLFDHINIDKKNTHVPDGMAADIVASCLTYEKDIVASGGIDLQVLGIGSDGHIGFNEPTSSLASRTRIKTLTVETRQDNARFFNTIDEVPMHCITMGIGTIMESREVIFLAFGEAKADIVAQMVEGPITSMVPASALQMHPNVKVFVDDAAASKLTRKDYYNWVYSNKPSWQQY
jgi:glucosamine-6-phosphate deaminase